MKPERIVIAFEPEIISADLGKARYNIAPTQDVPVIASQNGRRVLAACQWGMRDSSFASRIINARADTIAVKPTFRSAFRESRCLIPADGFYEWQKTGNQKQPVYIRVDDGEIFAMAGLYSTFIGQNGQNRHSCAIITTKANGVIRPIHCRMPAILGKSDWFRWIDPDMKDVRVLQEMLRPFDEKRISIRRVSSLVNSPSNDSAQCIEAGD